MLMHYVVELLRTLRRHVYCREMDEDVMDNIDAMVASAAVALGEGEAPVRQHDSLLSRNMHFDEIMATENVFRYVVLARINCETFLLFLELLKDHGNLKNSMFITAGEKMMILIYVRRGHTNCESCERWQLSGATISPIVYGTVTCLRSCSKRIF